MKAIRYVLLAVILLSFSSQAAYQIPKYERYVLANGLTVILMKQDEVPLVDIRLVNRSGSILDNGASGLAQMTSESLIFGAGNKSKKQLEDLFDSVGANYFSYAGKERSVMGLSFAKSDQSELMPIFSDLALNPQFNGKDFKKYKARYLSQLEQKRESPRNIIGDAFNHLYFGKHPYASPTSGTASQVKKISTDKVKRFYRENYVPQNSAIVVVGDIDIAQWKKVIAENFSAWKGKLANEKLLPSVSVPERSNVLLINKSDAIETTFMIGGKGLPADHKDATALSVVNTILGGRFTSWLNDALRVNSGLTYGARSRFNSYSKAGTFAISTFTKKKTTFEAIDLALKTYGNVWEKGIDSETLQSAKAYVKGRFPTRYETGSQLSDLLARMWALNLSDDYINHFEDAVNSLTVEKANALAKKYLPKDNLQFVLVGNADFLREKASKYGKVKQIEIEADSF